MMRDRRLLERSQPIEERLRILAWRADRVEEFLNPTKIIYEVVDGNPGTRRELWALMRQFDDQGSLTDEAQKGLAVLEAAGKIVRIRTYDPAAYFSVHYYKHRATPEERDAALREMTYPACVGE